jgi:hypothetical protein
METLSALRGCYKVQNVFVRYTFLSFYFVYFLSEVFFKENLLSRADELAKLENRLKYVALERIGHSFGRGVASFLLTPLLNKFDDF